MPHSSTKIKHQRPYLFNTGFSVVLRQQLYWYTARIGLQRPQMAFLLYFVTSCIDTQLELVDNVPRWPLSSFNGLPQHKRPWLWPTLVADSILITTLKPRPSYESAHSGRSMPHHSAYLFFTGFIFSPTSCIGSQLELITNSPNGPCRHLLGKLNTCDRDYGRHHAMTLYWL